MSNRIKSIFNNFVKCDCKWNFLNRPFVKLAQHAEFVRREEDRKKATSEAIQTITPDHIVINGPFIGMKYAETKSAGSALFPKLLGCYERELHPVIERVCNKPYTQIVDIGCAEGYYAIGLAMRIPEATVYAFDTDKEALRLCTKMAQANKVENRVIGGTFCDSSTLNSIPFTEKGLIFCDCEGYEKELFTEKVLKTLSSHDMIIEIHDGVDPSISPHIRKLFEKTHELEVIDVLSDVKKLYDYKEIMQYDIKTRHALVSEARWTSTEWYYLTSK